MNGRRAGFRPSSADPIAYDVLGDALLSALCRLAQKDEHVEPLADGGDGIERLRLCQRCLHGKEGQNGVADELSTWPPFCSIGATRQSK